MNQLQIIIFSIFLITLILLLLFSIAETSLMAINRYKLRHQARLKKPYAIRLLKLLKHTDRLLGVILIGSTFVNILASSLATLIAYHYFGQKGAFLAALILTFIVLIFAEITPKILAAIYPDKIAYWVAYPIKIILILLYPIVAIAIAIVNTFLKILHVKVNKNILEPLTKAELRSIVYDSSKKMSRRYHDMLLGILDLNKLSVEDVMIPQHEIIGIDINLPWVEIVSAMQVTYENMILIYKENINQILGFVSVKELLIASLGQSDMDKNKLQRFLKEPYFVPIGTSLNIQLKHFQRAHEKLALVIDEYGEIQGLLTLNHIIEEIIGDFQNQLSTTKIIDAQADQSYLVDGSVTIREFNKVSKWHLPSGGPRTVNGLIVEYLEALPHVKTAVLIDKYPIEIILVEDNKVKLAKIFPRLR